jgi:site-specific DNA-methyltransferase (adenine-specific)
MQLDILYNEDCLEGMKRIPDGSVDMILCDLPYGTTACKWDSVIPFGALWEQYKRIVKKNAAIVLTASQPFTAALAWSNLAELKYSMVWVKSRVGGFFDCKFRPLKAHEDVLVFSRGGVANGSSVPMKFYPQDLHACSKEWRIKPFSGNTRTPASKKGISTECGYPKSVLLFDSEASTKHPTQKPVAPFEYLIRTYTNEKETVLDSCVGSGTTSYCVHEHKPSLHRF